MTGGGRATLAAGALAVILVPLLALPVVAAREDAPDRPGIDAECPEGLAGGLRPAEVEAQADLLDELAAQDEIVDDGPTASFSSGGTDFGGGGPLDRGPGPGSGTTPGPTSPVTPPTIPPEEVAAEVVDEQDEPRRSSSLPLILGLLVLAAAALALALSRLRGGGDRGGAGGDADGAAGRRRRIPPVTSDLEARVRAAFLSGLLQLDRLGLVPYDESVPSGRIRRRLAEPWRAPFRDASATFDEVVYGRRPPTVADVERIEAGFAAIAAAARPVPAPA